MPLGHQVWAKLASLVRVDAILPNSWAGISSITAWLKHYTTNPIQRWKGTHSLVMLASWEIWRERNTRVFQKEELSVEALVSRIHDEAILWNLAGASIPFDPG